MDRGRDRLLLWFLLAHAPLAGLVASIQDPSTLVHALGEAAILPVLAALAYWRLAGTRAFRCVGAVLMMGYSGLLIHLSGGMIELHFHVFVGMALLIIYFDWLPISIAGATIALHHLVLNFVAPTSVFANGTSRSVVGIHAIFVVAHAAGLGYIAERLRRGLTAVGSAADQLATVRPPELVATIRGIADGDLSHEVHFDEMAGSAHPVGLAIDEIALVAGDTTAATDEVSTASADTSARMGEMRSRASALAATAEQLRALVGRFRLGRSQESGLS